MPAHRPVGVSSRLHRPAGATSSWTAGNRMTVELPLVVDLVSIAEDGRVEWCVEATVACVAGRPCVVRVVVEGKSGLDLRALQARFRWATPLDIVERTVPALIAEGRDPFAHDYAAHGYPDAAQLRPAPHRRLSDEFLLDVSRRYVDCGRGYAAVLAEHYQVAPRTVVSWVEKARHRGLLTATRPGAAGGEVRER